MFALPTWFCLVFFVVGAEGGKTLFRHAKECPDYDSKNCSSNREKSSAKVVVGWFHHQNMLNLSLKKRFKPNKG